MAHLLRLIFAVLVAVFSLSAHAVVPTVPRHSVCDFRGCANGTYYGPSASDACSQTLPGLIARDSPGGWVGLRVDVVVASGNNYCTGYGKPSSTGAEQVRSSVQILVSGSICPANSTASGSSCACTSPYVENAAHTACQMPVSECESIAGQSAGNSKWEDSSTGGTQGSVHYFCDGWNPKGGGKCVAMAERTICAQEVKGGPFYCTGPAKYTGATASTCNGLGGDGNTPQGSTPIPADGQSPAVPAPGTTAPSPCPTGQAPGTINGTSVCAPRGPDTPVVADDHKEVKNPDGSTTRTDGTTTCTAGKCTTNSTVCNTPSGGTTASCSTTTTTESQQGLCAQNKGSKVCEGQGEGTPSSFTGNCVTGFKAVSDDAVLNAMAQEQYKRNCELLRTDQEPSTWVAAEGQKATNVLADSPNNAEFSIGPDSFDTSDALGGGGCSLNKTVTVRGYSVALPFNVLCDPLAIFGQILVAFAFLLGARIVTRG